MEQLSEQTYSMYVFTMSFLIFFLHSIPGCIFSRVHRRNLRLQVVANSLIIKSVGPDLP